MVIQRWQSVFLLVATALMVLFIILPFGSVTVDAQVSALVPKDYPVYLVLNLLIAVLLFIAIFLYKNLRRQKIVTLVSILLIACSAVTGGLLLYGPAAPDGVVALEWGGGISLLIATLIMVVAAYRGISRDQRTLSSYDRIR